MSDSVLNLGYNVEALIAKDEPSRELVEKLQEWIKTENGIPNSLTKAQLVLFLLACNCKINDTKKCITNYYSAKKNGPELFNFRDINRADVQLQLKTLIYTDLPQDTDEGYRIIFHRLRDTNPSNYHMEPAMKTFFMSIDAALYRGPPKGLIMLFDMKGMKLTHLTRTKLGAVRKFCNYLQEGLPVRLHAIHILNTLPLIDKVLFIVKPFMKTEIYNMIHLHSPDMDWNEFYEKYIPRKNLPSDFGGDLPSIDELHGRHVKTLETLMPYFKAEETQRLGIGNNNSCDKYTCVEEDFQKLEID